MLHLIAQQVSEMELFLLNNGFKVELIQALNEKKVYRMEALKHAKLSELQSLGLEESEAKRLITLLPPKSPAQPVHYLKPLIIDCLPCGKKTFFPRVSLKTKVSRTEWLLFKQVFNLETITKTFGKSLHPDSSKKATELFKTDIMKKAICLSTKVFNDERVQKVLNELKIDKVIFAPIKGYVFKGKLFLKIVKQPEAN